MKQEYYNVSPFYKHHLDSILYFGRNVSCYKLELNDNQVVVNVYPSVFPSLISYLTGLSRRELTIEYSKIDEVKLIGKTLYLCFIEKGDHISYGIYHPENKAILKIIKNRLIVGSDKRLR